MQCTSYSPGLHSRRDLNAVPTNGHWPMSMCSNDISPNMSGQSCNIFYPQPNADQVRAAYHNEVLKQTMLRHDSIFRDQVQELHRLHKRQRELMDGFKRRGLEDPNIVSMTWQAPRMTCQTATAPTFPWITPVANNLSTPDTKSFAFSCLDIVSENKNGFENNQELPPECKKAKRKMLDLELPGDEYLDSENEEGSEIHSNTSPVLTDRIVDMMEFDLNMPPTVTLEPESQTIVEIKVEEKPQNDNKHDQGVFETKSKINQFDLNICVVEDGTSPTLPISKTIQILANTDLEAPVSPENKEHSPPRGNSEEYSDPNDDLLSTAAETILLISKNSFTEKTEASLVKSLDWFAGIVVSSTENDRSEKEESECVVALPSQQGKRHRKARTNRKVLEREAFRSLAILKSCDLGFSRNGLKSWGEVNKRRRGSRVPACSIRLLWS